MEKKPIVIYINESTAMSDKHSKLNELSAWIGLFFLEW